MVLNLVYTSLQVEDGDDGDDDGDGNDDEWDCRGHEYVGVDVVDGAYHGIRG